MNFFPIINSNQRKSIKFVSLGYWLSYFLFDMIMNSKSVSKIHSIVRKIFIKEAIASNEDNLMRGE